MKVRESARIGWRAITSHRLRSALTTLGVIIGVGAVITFMVLGGAFAESIVGDLDEDHEPIVIVSTMTEGPTGEPIPADAPIYTESDLSALEERDGVDFVAPTGPLSVTQTDAGDERQTGVVQALGTTPDLFTYYFEFVEGEAFTPGEDEAVVNEELDDLFETDVSAGDELVLSHADGSTSTVTVVGVVDEEEFGQPPAPTVYLPADPHYTVEIETPGGDEQRAYRSLFVGAENLDEVDDVRDSVAMYLETDSDAVDLKQPDHEFQVQTVDDAIDQFLEFVDQLTFLIAGIAGIALVVGSIGIANIMIVSVTERTRQIGIMKAVGARKRDVLQLFLVESIILGAIGAAAGVLVGLGVGYAGASYLDWPMVYPLDWIVIAVIVGVVVGIVSGLYPAWRAARVDPIEALRHE